MFGLTGTGGLTGCGTGSATGGVTGGSTGGVTGGSTGGVTGGSTGGATGGSTGGLTGGVTGAGTGGPGMTLVHTLNCPGLHMYTFSLLLQLQTRPSPAIGARPSIRLTS